MLSRAYDPYYFEHEYNREEYDYGDVHFRPSADGLIEASFFDLPRRSSRIGGRVVSFKQLKLPLKLFLVDALPSLAEIKWLALFM